MISTTDYKTRIKNLILFVAGLLIAALIITIIGIIKNNSIIFPSLIDIFGEFFRLLGTGSTYKFIGITLVDFIIVMLLSTIIGMTLGTLSGMNSICKGLVRPFLIIFRSMPMIVLIVIIMLTVPTNNYRYVPIIATTIALVPITAEAIAEGMARVDKTYIDVYKLNSNMSPRVVFKVYYPLCAGYIKQAIVNAIGIGIKIIVTTEYIAGVRNTLGVAVFNAKIEVEYAEIYAWAIILIIIVLVFEAIPTLISYGYRRIFFKDKA